MYREWLSACSCSTADRRGAIAALLHTLPAENFHNLKYFLAFLHHVSLNSDVNKMTASNLAHSLSKQGQWAEAEEMLNRTRAAQKRKHAQENPDSLYTAFNLVVCLADQGKHAEAERVHRKLLETMIVQHGPDHAATAIIDSQFAVWLSQQGLHAEAEEKHRRVLVRRQQDLPP